MSMQSIIVLEHSFQWDFKVKSTIGQTSDVVHIEKLKQYLQHLCTVQSERLCLYVASKMCTKDMQDYT